MKRYVDFPDDALGPDVDWCAMCGQTFGPKSTGVHTCHDRMERIRKDIEVENKDMEEANEDYYYFVQVIEYLLKLVSVERATACRLAEPDLNSYYETRQEVIKDSFKEE